MSGTRRKPGRPPGSKNKNSKASAKPRTSARASAGKAAAQGKTGAAKASEGRINSRVKDEHHAYW